MSFRICDSIFIIRDFKFTERQSILLWVQILDQNCQFDLLLAEALTRNLGVSMHWV